MPADLKSLRSLVEVAQLDHWARLRDGLKETLEEMERLQHAHDELARARRRDLDAAEAQNLGLTAACADLRAERDALREALGHVLDEAKTTGWMTAAQVADARAALSRGGK